MSVPAICIGCGCSTTGGWSVATVSSRSGGVADDLGRICEQCQRAVRFHRDSIRAAIREVLSG